MDSLLKSWRTSLAGILAGVVVVSPELIDLLSSEEVDIPNLIMGAALVIIGYFARDNAVSSEEAGAR